MESNTQTLGTLGAASKTNATELPWPAKLSANPSGVIDTCESVIKNTSQVNYHLCVAFILALEEHHITAAEDEEQEIGSAFRRLKEHARGIAPAEWHATIERAECKVQREKKEKEEDFADVLINLAVEVLIRTSSTEIETAIAQKLGSTGYDEERRKDPRSLSAEDGTQCVLEEILSGLLCLAPEQVGLRAPSVARMLSVSDASLVSTYMKGAIAKYLPAALYVHNPEVYSAVQWEALAQKGGRKEKQDALAPDAGGSLLSYVPVIDLDRIIKELQRNSSALRLLDSVMKERPVHRERIVQEVAEYLKKGARTRTLMFIRDNLAHFRSVVADLQLSCEEVLHLAERDKSLLLEAFQDLVGIAKDLQEKKQPNFQRKEKRLSALITVAATHLASRTPAETCAFLRATHEKGSETLARLYSAAFRGKQQPDEVKRVLEEVLEKTKSLALVFSLLPSLDEEKRCVSLHRHLRDEHSLSLFLRLLPPEKILFHAHFLPPERARTVIGLCLKKPHAFTDQIVSYSVAEVARKPGEYASRQGSRGSIPGVVMYTLVKALKVFPNMKPFAHSFLRREARRVSGAAKKDALDMKKILGEQY